VKCRELLERLQMEQTFGFAQLLTGDESWLYLNYSHTHMWSVSDDERLVRVNQTITSEKQMPSHLWSIKGPLVIQWLGPGDTFRTTYFCDVIIAKLVQALHTGGTIPRP
jgi:hypothetical protein